MNLEYAMEKPELAAKVMPVIRLVSDAKRPQRTVELDTAQGLPRVLDHLVVARTKVVLFTERGGV